MKELTGQGRAPDARQRRVAKPDLSISAFTLAFKLAVLPFSLLSSEGDGKIRALQRAGAPKTPGW